MQNFDKCEALFVLVGKQREQDAQTSESQGTAFIGETGEVVIYIHEGN